MSTTMESHKEQQEEVKEEEIKESAEQIQLKRKLLKDIIETEQRQKLEEELAKIEQDEIEALEKTKKTKPWDVIQRENIERATENLARNKIIEKDDNLSNSNRRFCWLHKKIYKVKHEENNDIKNGKQ